MHCEVYWEGHLRVYIIVNEHNEILMITRDFRKAKSLLGFLDTSKIPDTVYL